MKRILLIARREYAAYAKTVGFWLSLLAFPIFGVLGGILPTLMMSSEPTREAVVLEQGPQAEGLAAAVRDVLQSERERRAARQQEAVAVAEKQGGQAGASAAGQALNRLGGLRLEIVDTPADLAASAPGEARETLVRHYLGDDAPEADQLDSVVLLNRVDGKPSAEVWTRRATDDTVQDFVRDALKDINQREIFLNAGINPGVVEETQRFRPDVTALSPKSVTGGEVSFRDRLPGIIGVVSGFILWSLIITGASILLNSVMEEKANKILEVLLSSASATEILTGKVLGVAMLTLTVLLVWGGIGAFGLIAGLPAYAGDIADVLLQGGMIGYFIAYAVGGYLMYAVLFAAIGAFCETPRDAQTLMGPIMMILMVPIFVMLMAIRTPDAPLVQFLSWVPFFTPFLMSARAPSEPPMIEVVGTMGGMFVFALFMVWFAGRAFRAGALSDVKLSWKSFAGAIRGGGK
ncbi:MAG: ABC transporter permease [Alphaproteobacteria bacterium]|jgi:ABC-2 type transport system permease protein|nr:ABC transporter permease [Alphaproteobacteria bacterium]MBU2041980.1 ABC transporter permease [Alphaproteobacteria bacterium]MBU2125134.1 ABC transporter permease [Alphaproteobacteria bacterium]MBU2207545.1 ABC transporter permease [Alphaproteobacteria bacterium]MBU2292074.1 ABC transporter permease [Alphaproteobacteria bacterium]